MKIDAEVLGKLFAGAKMKLEISPTPSSKNWYSLVKIVLQLHSDNVIFKYENWERKQEVKSQQLHIDSLTSRIERLENGKAPDAGG